MEMRNRVLRFVAYSLEILLFFILQGVPNLIPEVLGGKPLLILPIALTIACFEKEETAMVFGVAVGVMMDLGYSAHIGFYTIALTIVCYLVGYVTENVFNTNLLTAVAISVLAIPVVLSLYFLFSYVIRGYDYAGYYYLHHTLPTIIYTFLTVPIFYGVNRALSRGFSESDFYYM